MSKPSGNAGMQNGFDISKADSLNERERSLVTRRSKLLGPSYKLMYEHPVEFVRGEGVYLYDADGNPYLDCYNNVCSVGHCNPRVVKAVSDQLATLNTHTRYMSEKILDFSEKLLGTFEPELGHVMYACSGSEAVDLSLRTAKFYTGGTGIIVTDYAYHGTTAAVSAISPSLGEYTPIDLHARTVRSPYAYRAGDGVDVEQRLADDVESAIKDMNRHGIKFAGILADSIFSSDGLFTAPKGFLQKTVDVVHKYGGLYIADEVQPGWARTGSHMWGYQNHGIVPDLVVMGKPMGNGMPISAMVARPEYLEDFGKKVRYFNTFAGNPVAIAAANAVFDELTTGGLKENCRVVGDYLLKGFEKISTRFSEIGDVRGAGMFFAVEFVKDPVTKEADDQLARKVVAELRERRILISTTGKLGNSLKIRPLLSFTHENADVLLKEFEDALKSSIAALYPGKKNNSSLTAEKHFLDNDFAVNVLKNYYGIEAVEAKKLNSERDENFLVHAINPDRKITIKFAHPSEDPLASSFQTDILRYLNTHDPSLPVQKIVPSTSGDSQIRINCDGIMRTARVVTFLDGQLLSDAPKSTVQAENLGKIAGRIAKALEGFSHPGQDHLLHWDVQHASQVRVYLSAIKNPKHRELLEKCLSHFENYVKPKLDKLRKQVIHNDFSPQNLLVSAKDPDQVTGVLDFGDSVYTPLAIDPAVGAAYQLGKDDDLLKRAVSFVKGFHSTNPLTKEELSLIYDLVVTRTVIRIAISTWRAEKFPDNAAYILRNSANVFDQFEQLVALKDGEKAFSSISQ